MSHDAAGFIVFNEMGYGELSCPDRVSNVDVYQSVSGILDAIFRGRRVWRLPEV